METIKKFLLSISLLAFSTVNPLSVQDLIDSGQCPQVTNNRSLNLSHKGLTSLEGLQNIPNIMCVTRLRLSHNQLTHLPANIFNSLPCLGSLSLSYNHLIKLTLNTFNKLNELKNVYLIGNYINKKEIKYLEMKLNQNREFLYNIAFMGSQKNPLELARQQLHNKSVFDALRGRELGTRYFVRKTHKQKKDSPKTSESFKN